MRNCWSHSALASAIFIILGGDLCAAQVQQPITIEDLAGRVEIRMISLAPTGDQVAYLSVKGLPLENVYEIKLNLLTTDGKSEPRLLSEYHLAPDDVFEKDTGALQTIAGQFVWSRDGKELAYTTHVGPGMEVRVRALTSGSESVILKDSERIEITRKDEQLEVTTTSALRAQQQARDHPEDLSLLVKDGYRFYAPLNNPKIHGRYVVQHWKYAWERASVTRTSEADSVSYMGFPKEWVEVPPASGSTLNKSPHTSSYVRKGIVSPNGALVAVVENSTHDLTTPSLAHRPSQIILKDLTIKEREPRILVPSCKPNVTLTVLRWSADGQEVYYLVHHPRFSSVSAVDLYGRTREIHREESALFVRNSSSELNTGGSVVVLVRNSNLLPDQLVKINLKTGILTVLLSPNDTFTSRARPRVRFVPIECCDADFWGRLYLPPDYHEGGKYPLVFTNYISSPGFATSVGDEVPILAMVSSNIAVFQMNSSQANITSTSGDFRLETSRVDKPLRAMEWVYRKLTEEGLVDPERCGLTGLSYGAEIATYAYWKSKIFRTVSVATGGWEPMNYVLGGISYSRYLDSRGFSLPDGDSYLKWKELSAGLNARPDLPPLLVQSPDGEEYFTVETWFRLRRIGAQVEWYEYPGEGHVKSSPANKWWVYQRNLDWFRFWLKGEEDPDPSKAEQYARWRDLQKLRDASRKASSAEVH
jgi:dipeptidyl aminopeptidase/acylaminoacyl peptidase